MEVKAMVNIQTVDNFWRQALSKSLPASLENLRDTRKDILDALDYVQWRFVNEEIPQHEAAKETLGLEALLLTVQDSIDRIESEYTRWKAGE